MCEHICISKYVHTNTYMHTSHAIHICIHTCMYKYVYVYISWFVYVYILSCRFLSAKVPLIILQKINYKDISTYIYISHAACVTGRQRCIGFLMVQVSFRKKATNYRARLQEMTCKDKASYTCSPPCSCPY